MSVTAKTYNDKDTGIAFDFDQMACFKAVGTVLHEAGVCRILSPALLTATAVGWRRGEVIGLRWRDVDLERRKLYVRQNHTVENGVPSFGKTKSKTSQRDISMPLSFHSALEVHREAAEIDSIIRGVKLTGDTAVFATQRGTFSHPDNLHRTLQNLVDQSNPSTIKRRKVNAAEPDAFLTLERRLIIVTKLDGKRAKLEAVLRDSEPLPNVSPHDLRHMMLRRKMPVEVVSKILGHADASITLNVYRRVLESEKEAEMVDLFPELVLA